MSIPCRWRADVSKNRYNSIVRLICIDESVSMFLNSG